MLKKCSCDGCFNQGSVCVKGMWFCRLHCPVVFNDENIRKKNLLEE